MRKRVFLVAAAISTGLAAAAQPRPDPRDAKAKVPPVEYRSAFESYRRHSEPEVSGWREMNEEVRRIGGHVGIAREAAKPEAKPTPEAGHGGHK